MQSSDSSADPSSAPEPGPGKGPDLEPARVRSELAALGADARKIAGGLVVVMMREPNRVRDREWLLENFTVLSAKALELGDEDQAELKAFVRRERDAVMNATFRLFLRVAEDMRGLTGGVAEGGASGTLGQATMVALSYFDEA